MSSLTPFSEPGPAVGSTSEMAEVITLSDDDDVVPLTPRQPMGISTTSNQPETSIATAHIGSIVKLNLEDLQVPFKRLSDVVHRNQVVLHGDNGNGQLQVGRRIGQPIGPLIRRPPLDEAILAKRPSPPNVPNVAPSTSTAQRARRDQTAQVTPYKGHYMFEATEGYEPSRRSSRFNTKKIDGNFVCTYCPMKCYKLCSTTVEVINHAWAHVVHDPPPYISRAARIATTGDFEDCLMNAEGSQAVLADNSRMTLRRMQTCEFCNSNFDTVYTKQQHVIDCHINQDTVETVCNICELDFYTAIGLASHMKKHPVGDAPYHCRKCKYRTSVRKFFFQHFVDKHSNDFRQLFCPFCLYQEDLRPNTRRTKHIFVRSFFDHMMKHVTHTQFRCRMCALSFSDGDELNEHRQNDHIPLNPLWQTNDRPQVHEPVRFKISKRNKIAVLQKRFLDTLEGKRISEEISKDTEERMGYDTTNVGNTLYECTCGNFQSYNGNRTASHYHRCRLPITDINRDRETSRPEQDDEEEMKLFAVYPQMTMTELECKAQQDELNAVRVENDQYKIHTDEIEFDPVDDLITLKMLASGKDKSAEIIEECLRNLKTDDE